MNSKNRQIKDIDRSSRMDYLIHKMSLKYLIGLRDRLKRELAEVEKVLAGATKDGGRFSAAVVGVADSGRCYGSLGTHVESAVVLCGSTFTISDVKDKLELFHGIKLSTVQIATVLARFKAQGKIRMVQPKRGNIAAIYQKGSIRERTK